MYKTNRSSFQSTLTMILLGVCGFTSPGDIQAQKFAPVSIAKGNGNSTNQVSLSWPATPGQYYDLLTRDGLDAPWLTNGLTPIRANSTQSSVKDAIDDPNVLVRFYQIKPRPISPGNTNPIVSATVAELEKVLGLTLTPGQRSQLLSGLRSRRANYEAMRKARLQNSDTLPLVFDPRPPSFTLTAEQKPIVWSVPKTTRVPTIREELAFYTVRNLGELIRTRQITSTELTQLYLNRIKRHDSKLYSVITLTEALALKQAARADEELASGTYRGPLHGIPYGVKDLFATRSYRTTWGAAQFKDQIIDEDATVVKKLEEAGAVLIAKLSTGELAVGEDWFGGRTRNPWDLSQGASGSSAGPAAATSAGLVAFGIGTETYGSIIGPSTRCRVTGLRPTFGRVSHTGVMSQAWSMDKIGPICREVEDCAIVLEAIRGADGMDRSVVDAPFNYTPHQDLKELRIGYRHGLLSPTILNRLAAIVGSERLVEVTLPTTPVDAILIIEVESAASFDEMVRFGGDNYLLPFNYWRGGLLMGRTVPAVEYLQANRHRQKLIKDMAELMEQIDVFVTTQADLVGAIGNPVRGLLNMTGHPCVNIPHGGDTCLGFVGQLYDEATILSLAKAYQDATPYHTNHPPAFLK